METNSAFNNQADNELIQDALSGSKTALERILKQHYNFIYNVALRFVLNPADAQDLTQEAIIKVITKLSQFNYQSEFRTWLYRIVFNHFLNSKRQKMEYAVVSFDEYGLALDNIPNQDVSTFEEKEMEEKIEDAKIGCMVGMLLCLNREQRMVYILGEIFEIDSKTGSVLLEMSSDNFRQLLSRARKDLYHFMNDKCGLINTQNPCRCPKKTKGFIQAGWVNENNLQFNNHFLRRVSDLAIQKSNQCDNVLEERYGALYKDHPFYDRDNSTELLQKLTEDPELKDIFNL
jgi:RNA polymerase sigma factor (sigma-70 family)